MQREDRIRGARPFDQIRISALDVRLGVRIFVKYRWLSAVAVIGMTVAIAIGAGAFGFLAALFDTSLPLDQPERVVSIQYRDFRQGLGNRQRAGDFLQWRGALRSVKDLAAFSDDRRNLIIPGRVPEPVDIAEMTASGFRVAGTAPLRGRTLLDEDELPDAPPVLVIAWDEWQRRFDGDSSVVGTQVGLGGETHTIVGVMPEGFLFPIRHHFWTVLRLPSYAEPGSGPPLNVFARLADGATTAQTLTELTLLHEQTATVSPRTHTNLRPRVLPYAAVALGDEGSANIVRLVWHILSSLLLAVVAVNVAVLVYARTAARTGEIAMRTALGASRTRIVTQLFVEAFVLCGTAAVLGLTVAAITLAQVAPMFEKGMPYWTSFSLSPSTVIYVVALAFAAALIVGVLPALPGTGRRLQAGLQRLGSHGSQMTLGRGWTAMIVAQVAIAVAVLPFAVGVSATMVGNANSRVSYPIEQFLRTSVAVEREAIGPTTDTATYRRDRALRFQDRAAELLRRLEAEPAVAGVAYATHFGDGGRFNTIEVDSAGGRAGADTAESSPGRWTGTNRVAPNFFNILDVPIVAGRGFTRADALDGSSSVIVDRGFVERFLGDGSPLGRRLRFTPDADERAAGAEPGPWLEIVGVVSDFMTGGEDFQPSYIYQAATLDQLSAPVSLAIRIRGAPPATFAPRLREITAAVDPSLRLERLGTATAMERERRRLLNVVALGIVVVTGSVLLLSAAGIYAMMSFTVVRRRREIGIRAALGAEPRRILMSIFGRASAQLATGVVIGLLLALALGPALDGEGMIRQKGIVLFPVVAGTIMLVGILAALGPARRGLSIQPTEALREE